MPQLHPLDPLPFAKLMGVTVVSVTPDLVIGEMQVTKDLCTRPDVLHGGAYMAFADTVGAVATVANLPDGMTTTTIESKTNFFSGIPLDRKSTRLNSSHGYISYAVFCLKKKKQQYYKAIVRVAQLLLI